MKIKEKSEALYARAEQVFPAGVNSPVRAFRSVHGKPLFMAKGEGSKLFDADGNEYLDLNSSWGPLISGHAHPVVVDAVKEAAEKGVSFGAPCEYELELGELIVNGIKDIDQVRFVSSGTEAVMSALRLARGATGRDKIIKFNGCYHGHVDSLLVKAGSGLATFGVSDSAGVPEDFAKHTLIAELDDIEAVQQLFDNNKDEVAAIIIEPIPANNGLLLQRKEYLEQLRDLCDANGALLIFDEVISGFRVGFGGAAEHYGIKPDIVTYGKVIGGGTPVGAYGASNELMNMIAPNGPVYQAGTLSGNPLAMAAGTAQLRLCQSDGFYEDLEVKTSAFVNAANEHFKANAYPMTMVSIGSIFWLSIGSSEAPRKATDIDAEGIQAYADLHAALLERGVYAAPSGYEVGFISSVHSNDDMDFLTRNFIEAVDVMMEKSALGQKQH